jgi:hypothetical protein
LNEARIPLGAGDDAVVEGVVVATDGGELGGAWPVAVVAEPSSSTPRTSDTTAPDAVPTFFFRFVHSALFAQTQLRRRRCVATTLLRHSSVCRSALTCISCDSTILFYF